MALDKYLYTPKVKVSGVFYPALLPISSIDGLQTAINSKQDTITSSNKLSVNLVDGALQSSDILNVVNSTATNKALSANMGKELQDQINNLKQRGRYLSVWNCTTGLATTTPTVDPYTYKAGDYFIIGVVGTTNYKPSGTTYSASSPSTTVETNTVQANDTYYYDGTSWTLLQNAQVSVTFASLAGSPSDNSNLANALNAKQDNLPTTSTAGKVLKSTSTAGTMEWGDADAPSNMVTTDTAQHITNDKYFDNYKYLYFGTNGQGGKIYSTTGSLMITNPYSSNIDLIVGSTGANEKGIAVTKTFLRPKVNNNMDLGNSSYKWKDLYLAGNVTDGTNTISVSEIVNKQDAITSTDKLDADLVDDTTSTNKFVTANDKTTWNAKQDVISDLSTIRSGATAGGTALQPNDNISELTNDAGYLTAHQDISGKANVSEAGYSLDLSMNSTTYVVTATLKNKAGTALSTQSIDLPLESVVVSGRYDSSTKKVILTLQGGSTIEFSVADLVSGLQTEITSSNKLSVNLIDGIATVATSGSYNDLSNKPTIPYELADLSDDATHRLVTDTDKSTWNTGTTYYVEGTGTTEGTWLGTINGLTSYYDGLKIFYKVPIAGDSTTTLNINGLGAKTIYRYSSSKLTTQYGVNYVVGLVYSASDNKFYVISDYDANTITVLQVQGQFTAGGVGIFTKSIFAKNTSGTYESFTTTSGTSTSKVANTSAKFTIGEPLYYLSASSNVTAGDQTSTSAVYLAYQAVDVRYTGNYSATSFGTFKQAYLNVTIDETTGTYSPASELIRAGDNLTSGQWYIYLGYSYKDSAYQINLDAAHNLYYYDGTNLIEYSVKKAGSSGGGSTVTTNGVTQSTWETNTKQDVITSSNKLSSSLVSGLASVATSGNYSDLSGTPTIPTKVSDLTNDAGYTTNTGTITGITMNGASKGTSGVVDLGTVITEHQSLAGKQDVNSKLTSISGLPNSSTGLIKLTNGVASLDSTTYAQASQLANYQPLDADLTAIAGLSGTSGLLKKTAANTWALDTNTYLTGITSSQVTNALGYTPYNSTNPNGYTSNTGTVTSVQVQAGTGLSSSQSSAQTGTLNTTISVASGYKLPTTTEWGNKADASALANKLDATKCTYQTTAPTSAISDGGVHIVYLTSEPATKYSGYIYFIAES